MEKEMDKKIYPAICAITKEIGAIGKDKKNVQQNFMFRGIDQVMNTLHPLLAEFGVFVLPEVIETQREERQTRSGGNLIYTVHKVRYHFTAIDGSEVCATVVGEGMDSADKSSNKAMAVAFKYACFQVFCIPTEEMAKDDADYYSPEPSTPKAPVAMPKASIDYEEAHNICAQLQHCDTKEDLRQLWDTYPDYHEVDMVKNAFTSRKLQIANGGAK